MKSRCCLNSSIEIGKRVNRVEERLKFHGNERVKRIQEVRKRNRRKRRIWVGLFVMLCMVASLFIMDRNGFFELFFNQRVLYEGNTEYLEVLNEEGAVSRSDLLKLSQTLINHPYSLGQESLSIGKPEGPLGSAAFVDWVFLNLTGEGLSEGSDAAGPLATKIWENSTAIMENELKPGDLGFTIIPEGSKVNNMGIYLGEIDGNPVFIHAGGVQYKAEGLPEGRIVVSFNNVLKRNNKDIYGQTFSPSAASTQFIYYRRPNVTFIE